jgi:hypothetical protein
VLLLKVDSEWARLVIGGFLTVSGLNLIFSGSSPGGASPVFGALRWLVEVVIGLVIGFLATVTGLMLGSVRMWNRRANPFCWPQGVPSKSCQFGACPTR